MVTDLVPTLSLTLYGTFAYSLTGFFVTGCSIRPKIVKINLKKAGHRAN